jgi:hypothetical protein
LLAMPRGSVAGAASWAEDLVTEHSAIPMTKHTVVKRDDTDTACLALCPARAGALFDREEFIETAQQIDGE